MESEVSSQDGRKALVGDQDLDRNSGGSSDEDSDLDLLQDMAKMKVSEDGPGQYLGTGFIYDELFSRHKCIWDDEFPECPNRVLKPFARCQELGLVQRCVPMTLNYATEDQILWHHAWSHLELAKATATMTNDQRKELAKRYDAWYSNEATFESSLAAAGSTIKVLDQILQKKITNGFAMVRPPGHHAMHNEFCGYCTFNNIALAATHALNSGCERVLIVDWDVHHGQGTQYMFYEDPRVLFISIHRYEYGTFWPNLRESDYYFIGKGRGRGYNVNVPLNKTGMEDTDYLAIFHQIIMPLAYEYSPQVVLISAGYDAAIGCPEGEMLVSPAAYAHFTHMLSALAQGRVLVVLEGGYCLQSLAEGCALTIRELLGDPSPLLRPVGEPSDSIITTILNVIKVLRPYWQCFKLQPTLSQGESLLSLEELNSFPPREGVVFSTPKNRPEEFQLMGFYPKQSAETIHEFAVKISSLIAETSLAVAPHRTGFVFDAEMRKHKNLQDSSHPERAKRISAIYEKHREWGLLKRCLQIESRLATEDEILSIHKDSYLQDLKVTATLDEDVLRMRPRDMNYVSIYLCKDTYHCALLAAGCVLQVTEAVLSGKVQNGVAVVRPPGHHAECNKAMGFCFFNSIAIAAANAKKNFGVKRILIVDWDVHHGNATQHQFYEDPSVLYISLHRYDNGRFFPGSPEAEHIFVGKESGTGFNVNIPWSKEKMGDAEYLSAFQHIIMPIAYQFAPELVLVSAGFDAAAGDFLGGYSVMPECYGHMTHMLSGLANGRLVLILEGGYNLNSISVSMATCTSVLLGDPCPLLKTGTPNHSAVQTIQEVLNIQTPYWPCLKSSQVNIPDLQALASVTDILELAQNTEQLKLEQAARTPGAGGREGADLAADQPNPKPQVFPQGANGDHIPSQQKANLMTSSLVEGTKNDSPVMSSASQQRGESLDSAAEGSSGSGETTKEEELLGACAGPVRPNTLADVLKMKGVEQLFAVEPLTWCPHLFSVQPLPADGLHTDAPCEECGDITENWVCLTCYKVYCSRYVQEHMLLHSATQEHPITLSYADLSVWCYVCNSYVDNKVIHPMKNAAHISKFDESLPDL